MLGALVLITFLAMVCMALLTLAACYSAARGLWFGAAFGALGALAMLHVMTMLAGQIEAAYADIKIERAERGLDNPQA
jgi:predicted aconitase